MTSDRARRAVFARKRYARFGLRLRGGGSQADRRGHEQRLDALEATGLCQFFRREGKRYGMKLTDDSDWRLRRAACHSDLDELLAGMTLIHAHESSPRRQPQLNWVAEWWITGADHRDRNASLRLRQLERILLPGLVRGYVRAWADLKGSTAYQLTDQGRRFLFGEFPSIDWPRWSQQAADIYDEAFEHARQIVDTDEMQERERLVLIPLSCGLWPGRAYGANVPGIFTKTGKVRSFVSVAKLALTATQKERKPR
jgi:hypothetical protein